MKKIAISIALSGLAACASPIKIPSAPGQQTIVPSTSPKIGHLYFSGQGARPTFQTSAGDGLTTWNALCYDDFKKTTALRDLSPYIVEDSVTMNKATGTLGADAGVGLTVAAMTGTASLGAKQTYTVENLRQISITDEGIELIESALGDGCRKLIADLEGDGREIVMLTSAQRADKVSDVTSFRAGIGAGAGTVSLGSGTGDVAVTVNAPGAATGGSFGTDYQYTLVFFTGLLGARDATLDDSIQ